MIHKTISQIRALEIGRRLQKRIFKILGLNLGSCTIDDDSDDNSFVHCPLCVHHSCYEKQPSPTLFWIYEVPSYILIVYSVLSTAFASLTVALSRGSCDLIDVNICVWNLDFFQIFYWKNEAHCKQFFRLFMSYCSQCLFFPSCFELCRPYSEVPVFKLDSL